MRIRVITEDREILGSFECESKGDVFIWKDGDLSFAAAYVWFCIDEEGNPLPKEEIHPDFKSNRAEKFLLYKGLGDSDAYTFLPGWKRAVPKPTISLNPIY